MSLRPETIACSGLVGAFIAALAWVVAPVLTSLHADWTDAETPYAHGYLLVLMAVYVAVRRWRAEPPAVSPGSPIVVLGLGVTVLGVLAGLASDTLIVAQFLLPLLLLTAVWTLAGSAAAERLAPALALLYFGVRIWDVLIEPLQSMTTAVTAAFVRAIEIPAFIDGNFIYIASGAFEIAGGCSGLNFFVVAGTLGYFYGLVSYRRWTARAVLCLSAFAVALVANWIRVISLVLIGYGTEMQHSLIAGGHAGFGWAVFFVAITPLFFVARRLERAPDWAAETPAAQRTVPLRARLATVPVGVAFCILLAGGWMGARASADLEPPPSGPIELPRTSGWNAAAEWVEATRPAFVAPAAEKGVWLRGNGGALIGVYVANYPAQRQGREAVFFDNRPGGRYAAVTRLGRRVVVGDDGAAIPFEEYRTNDAGEGERLLWVGMRVAGVATANAVMAKLWQALGVLSGRHDAQVLVLSVACDGSCDGARKLLTSYAQQAASRLYDGAAASSSL